MLSKGEEQYKIKMDRAGARSHRTFLPIVRGLEFSLIVTRDPNPPPSLVSYKLLCRLPWLVLTGTQE